MNKIMHSPITGVLLFVLVHWLWIISVSGTDTEINDLALQFENGFNSINNKLEGHTSSIENEPLTIEGADKKMHRLYMNLEKSLVDARQRAANARSSLTSRSIDRLRLV